MQLGRIASQNRRSPSIPLAIDDGCKGALFVEVPMVRSTRDVVLLQDVLKRMKSEMPCSVRAVKVCLWTLDISEYVSAEVADAPSELPDQMALVLASSPR
jgi:hypothetical protein